MTLLTFNKIPFLCSVTHAELNNKTGGIFFKNVCCTYAYIVDLYATEKCVDATGEKFSRKIVHTLTNPSHPTLDYCAFDITIKDALFSLLGVLF